MRRFEPALVAAIAVHSLAVGLMLLFATEWSVRFGGWASATPLFFPRQAGAFHLVVAGAYAIEYARSRGVTVLLFTKAIAVVFLVVTAVSGGAPWVVPFSAAGDAAMAVAVLAVRRWP